LAFNLNTPRAKEQKSGEKRSFFFNHPAGMGAGPSFMRLVTPIKYSKFDAIEHSEVWNNNVMAYKQVSERSFTCLSWPRIALFLGGVFACLMLFALLNPAVANPRYASLIMEETSGKVLYSRNADKKLYPASLTKIMTLYLLFEAMQTGKVSKNTKMKVSKVAAGRSPSKLYLKVGHSISVENAILALVTKSANDVATVVSEHLGGTEREFAKKMTRKAKALGMTRTTFKNASGLPNRAQVSTARDMAKLAIAMRRDFPQYFHYFSNTHFVWNGRKYKNHNRLLTSYKGTDGIKTGYINASGFNLVATVQRNGVRLIGVVFGGRTGRTRDKHMVSLLSKQFGRIKPVQVRSARLPAAPIPRPNTILKLAQSKALPKLLPAVPATTAPIPDKQTTALSATTLRPTPASWAIQVGSFTRRVSAHKAAIRARRTANDVLDLMPAELSLVSSGGLPLWRVRFSQLKEQEARSACAALLSTGAACIALPPALADAS
jgi:D-alanyl-D-alanine carboxypeptidase